MDWFLNDRDLRHEKYQYINRVKAIFMEDFWNTHQLLSDRLAGYEIRCWESVNIYHFKNIYKHAHRYTGTQEKKNTRTTSHHIYVFVMDSEQISNSLLVL